MKHIHIDYYGECKQVMECNEDEMKDFPRRMREWLFNVMHDLGKLTALLTEHLSSFWGYILQKTSIF